MLKLSIVLLTAWSGVAIAEDSDATGGWQAVAKDPQLKTNPDVLCGFDHQKPRADNRKLRACYDALQHAALSGGALECLAWVPKHPYEFTSFEIERACAGYDTMIQADQAVLKGQHSDHVANAVRADLQKTRSRKDECLRQARAAFDAALAARAKSTPAVPLQTIIDIPRAERIPAENARMSSELDACRSFARTMREERAKLAITRDISEPIQIDPKFRTPEETKRLEEHAAARTQTIEIRRADPKWMGPAVSGLLCRIALEKSEATKEIRTEQAYARQYGGVYDKAKIYDLQTRIRELDEEAALQRARLRRAKARETRCGDGTVRKIAICLPRDGFPVDSPDCTERILDHVDLITAPEFVNVPAE